MLRNQIPDPKLERMEFKLAKAGQVLHGISDFSHVNATESMLCPKRPASAKIVPTRMAHFGLMEDFQRCADT